MSILLAKLSLYITTIISLFLTLLLFLSIIQYVPSPDTREEQKEDKISTQELYQEMDRLDDDIRFQRRELGIIKHTPDSFDDVPQQDLGQSSQQQAAVNYSQGQQHELGSTTDSQRLAPGAPQRRAITSSLRYQALSQSYNFSSTTQSQQGRNLQQHTSPASFQQQDLPIRPQSVSVSCFRYDMYDESDSQTATSNEDFNDVQEDKLLDELEAEIKRLFDQQEEEEQKSAKENPEAYVYCKSKRKKFEEE